MMWLVKLNTCMYVRIRCTTGVRGHGKAQTYVEKVEQAAHRWKGLPPMACYCVQWSWIPRCTGVGVYEPLY